MDKKASLRSRRLAIYGGHRPHWLYCDLAVTALIVLRDVPFMRDLLQKLCDLVCFISHAGTDGKNVLLLHGHPRPSELELAVTLCEATLSLIHLNFRVFINVHAPHALFLEIQCHFLLQLQIVRYTHLLRGCLLQGY